MKKYPKDFLSISDLTKKQIIDLLYLAGKIKRELKTEGSNLPLLKNKTLAMVFEKPSLRTRVSFETGMTQLGGHAIYLAPQDIQLGVRESVSDVAQVLNRMCDGLMARVFKHETLVELAKYTKIPVINGLSDLEHPCQILGDILTIFEKKKELSSLTLAFIGDGENNITHSLALVSGILGIDFRVASPNGYSMLPSVSSKAQELAKKSGGKILETNDPKKAVRKADVVYTDTWVSMGDEKNKAKRLKLFPPYRVTQKLMALAKSNALFMHDLPAYRGNDVTSEVIDGPQSIIFDQAENRLHVQKALLSCLL